MSKIVKRKTAISGRFRNWRVASESRELLDELATRVLQLGVSPKRVAKTYDWSLAIGRVAKNSDTYLLHV